MAGPYKPVGVDSDSLFPPRVEARLSGDFVQPAELDAAYIPYTKTSGAVQDAINAAIAANRDLIVTPLTHVTTMAVANDADSLAIGSGLTVRGERGSVLELDPNTAGHSYLRHYMRIGNYTDGPNNVVIENITANVNQNQIKKWSRIVSRYIPVGDAYCEVVTATPHYLSVGDSVTIAQTELAALNATHTVTDVPSPTTFRVVGPTSGSHAVVSEMQYYARAYETVGDIDAISAITGDAPATLPNHVRIRDCVINNTSNAVRATRRNLTETGLFYYDWIVERIYGSNFSNKVVEFGFVSGGKVIDCEFYNADSGPQAIFWSRNIEFRNNRIFYVNSGINVTAGSHDVLITGNVVEARWDAPTEQFCSALFIRTENTLDANYDVYNIRSADNVYRNRVTTSSDALSFETWPNVTSSIFRDMSFTNDIFDGNVLLYGRNTPAKTTIHGLRFNDCRIGGLVTVSYATSKVYDVVFKNCDFTDVAAMTINASDMQFINCRFAGDVTISADASNVVMSECETPTAIVNNGTGTVLLNNRIGAAYPV